VSLESCLYLSFDSLVSNTALHNDEVQIALYLSCPNSNVSVSVSSCEHSTCNQSPNPFIHASFFFSFFKEYIHTHKRLINKWYFLWGLFPYLRFPFKLKQVVIRGKDKYVAFILNIRKRWFYSCEKSFECKKKSIDFRIFFCFYYSFS